MSAFDSDFETYRAQDDRLLAAYYDAFANAQNDAERRGVMEMFHTIRLSLAASFGLTIVEESSPKETDPPKKAAHDWRNEGF